MNKFGMVYMSTVGCGIVYMDSSDGTDPKPVTTTTTTATTTTTTTTATLTTTKAADTTTTNKGTTTAAATTTTNDAKITVDGKEIELSALLEKWTAPLEKVFPTYCPYRRLTEVRA